MRNATTKQVKQVSKMDVQIGKMHRELAKLYEERARLMQNSFTPAKTTSEIDFPDEIIDELVSEIEDKPKRARKNK